MKISISLSVLCLIAIHMCSCHKKSTPVNYGVKFDGTWVGINSCDSSTETITIHSPININSVYYSGHVDTGLCSKTVTFYGTAYGDTLTFPALSYTDLCGNGYTVRQKAAIVGVTLYLTRITTGTENDTCFFTATKI